MKGEREMDQLRYNVKWKAVAQTRGRSLKRSDADRRQPSASDYYRDIDDAERNRCIWLQCQCLQLAVK